MDPYLEHPALWADVHNSLIAGIRDDLAPRVAPRYYVSLESRVYLLKPDDLVLVGRPDLSVVSELAVETATPLSQPGVAVLEVDVPMQDEVEDTFLEVHEVKSGKLVTGLEILSPANKQGKGRTTYEEKRQDYFRTRTNLVEIDLLRAGEPMPVVGRPVGSDYRILVSRGPRRPHAQLYAFGVRGAIPSFALPLAPGDEEPVVELNAVLHGVYHRARFDLRLEYSRPPVPPLSEADAAWARELIESAPRS